MVAKKVATLDSTRNELQLGRHGDMTNIHCDVREDILVTRNMR